MINEMMEDRFFSIELKSKVNLKNVTLSNSGRDAVLLEGTIDLREAKSRKIQRIAHSAGRVHNARNSNFTSVYSS